MNFSFFCTKENLPNEKTRQWNIVAAREIRFGNRQSIDDGVLPFRIVLKSIVFVSELTMIKITGVVIVLREENECCSNFLVQRTENLLPSITKMCRATCKLRTRQHLELQEYKVSSRLLPFSFLLLQQRDPVCRLLSFRCHVNDVLLLVFVVVLLLLFVFVLILLRAENESKARVFIFEFIEKSKRFSYAKSRFYTSETENSHRQLRFD